ncbi:hypothetical protein U1Q18_032390 [Sarracenia purpurea var. burkii]
MLTALPLRCRPSLSLFTARLVVAVCSPPPSLTTPRDDLVDPLRWNDVKVFKAETGGTDLFMAEIGGRGFKAESEGGWIGEEKSVGEGLRWLATESGEVAEVNGGLCGGGSETGVVKIER